VAESLVELREQILNKDKDAVRELLGRPVKVTYWKNAVPAEGTDLAEFQAEALDEIWVYREGRVHFNLAGNALKVDDRAALHLPPPENIV
jgi:hypothetical protein